MAKIIPLFYYSREIALSLHPNEEIIAHRICAMSCYGSLGTEFH